MIKKLILRIKHSLIGYKTRCFIFGKTKTNSKDMKQIEKLRSELSELRKEHFFEDNEIKQQELQQKIGEVESQIEYIRNVQQKYILRIVTTVGDTWIDPYYSTTKLLLTQPINLSESNISKDLSELKIEIEDYLVNVKTVDLKMIKEIYIKKK